MIREDCINYFENAAGFSNRCSALKSKYACTSDCPFYAVRDIEKLRQRELDLKAYEETRGNYKHASDETKI